MLNPASCATPGRVFEWEEETREAHVAVASRRRPAEERFAPGPCSISTRSRRRLIFRFLNQLSYAPAYFSFRLPQQYDLGFGQHPGF